MNNCLFCEEKLEGRSAKKYCNAHCRSAYQYAKNKLEEPRYMEVQKILRTNRNLLKLFNKSGKSTVRAEILSEQGFNPNYFTNYWKNPKGEVYFFVFEFGFMKLSHNGVKKYLLIKWQSFMNS